MTTSQLLHARGCIEQALGLAHISPTFDQVDRIVEGLRNRTEAGTTDTQDERLKDLLSQGQHAVHIRH